MPKTNNTTPRKKKSIRSNAKTKPASMKKPPKTTRTRKPKYFIFTMQGGGDEFFDNAGAAIRFRSDNEDIIAKTYEFTARQAYIQQKALCAKRIVTPTKKKEHTTATTAKTEKPTLSPEEKAAVDRIAKRIDAKRPCNRIAIYYRTTGRSMKCVILVRFLNTYGQDQWFVKPDLLTIAITSYVAEFKQENGIMQEALENFDYSARRDPNGDKDEAAVTEWKSSDGKKVIHYDLHVAHTSFTIPYEDISSSDEEKIYIEDIMKTFGETLRQVLLNYVFMNTFKAAVGPDIGIWRSIVGNPTDGKKKNDSQPMNFERYIRDCKIKVEHCPNVNTHVVYREAQNLGNFLYENRLDREKYEPPPQTSSDDDDDDDDEDGEENKNSENDTELQQHEDHHASETRLAKRMRLSAASKVANGDSSNPKANDNQAVEGDENNEHTDTADDEDGNGEGGDHPSDGEGEAQNEDENNKMHDDDDDE